ncbi:MAG: twin-arginine translocation signal domain-containing protein, partial [Bryobacteraceae bacterium]
MASSRRQFLTRAGAAAAAATPAVSAAAQNPAAQPKENPDNALLKRSFVHGREYFVLRSGR